MAIPVNLAAQLPSAMIYDQLLNLLFQWNVLTTVDGRNPKQPPGMYPKPCKYSNGINYQPQLVSRISEPSTVLTTYEKRTPFPSINEFLRFSKFSTKKNIEVNVSSLTFTDHSIIPGNITAFLAGRNIHFWCPGWIRFKEVIVEPRWNGWQVGNILKTYDLFLEDRNVYSESLLFKWN